MTNTTDNVYYNITISNLENKDNYAPQPIEFTSTRNQSIIDDPSSYYCSVVRFLINGAELPIFSFQIQGGQTQTNENLGIASVTLKYMANESQQYLVYIPYSNFPPPPPPSANIPTYKPYDSAYYYVYEYQQYVDIINNALNAAFGAIPHPPDKPGKPVCAPPYMIFNINDQKFSVVAPRDYYEDILPDNERIDIFFNFPLINDFQGFNVKWNYNKITPNGKDVQIIIKNVYNNEYTPPNVAVSYPPNYLINTQQFNAITALNIFNSIIISSDSLPVESEYLSLINNNGNNTLFKTLTDFQPLLRSSGEFKGIFQYIPTIYRLIDMNSTLSLSYITIKVYWSDRFGNIRPLYQPYGSACSIKLLFVKKYLYQHYHPKQIK